MLSSDSNATPPEPLPSLPGMQKLLSSTGLSMLRCYSKVLAVALLCICRIPGTSAANQTATDFTEREAVVNLAQNIFPSKPQQLGQGWFVDIDPCGKPTCQPSNLTMCAWTGISCHSWHIIGIQLQPSVSISTADPNYESGSLSSHLGDLPQLHTLQLAHLG